MGLPAHNLPESLHGTLPTPLSDAPVAVVAVVAGGLVIGANGRAKNSFPQIIAGAVLSEALGGGEPIDEAVDHCLAGRPLPKTRVLTGDGRVLHLHLKRVEHGGRLSVHAWLLPDDEAGDAREQVSETVAMLAHQLRSPLASVRGSAELLRRYGERMSAERRDRALARVEDSVAIMTEILEDLLLAGRITAGQTAVQSVPLELCGAVEELVRNHQTAARVELVAAEEWVPVCADRTLLRHIVDNLLCNAAKYDPSGRPIRVRVTRGESGAVLSVQDRGIGIANDEQERVFAPFMRGSNVGGVQGTGLGLSLVRHAVRVMGGRVSLSSALGEGTTVRVQLPLGAAGPGVERPVDNNRN